jgi:hypothetical protein
MGIWNQVAQYLYLKKKNQKYNLCGKEYKSLELFYSKYYWNL